MIDEEMRLIKVGLWLKKKLQMVHSVSNEMQWKRNAVGQKLFIS